ncbi:MAG: hypothetical protein A4E53_02481 [Pelotomaculum sp. PtaB.Bin104]|nr:MAG: hypothetical protein A4E53_02481 [Pelotomaculum sp. PtaB.Bin104]
MTNMENCCSSYRYKIFDLHIASDLLLPELLTAIDTPDTPDVCISFGKVPVDITIAVKKTESCQIAKNQFLFRVPGVGCYYVTNGNCIIVEPSDQAKEVFVRLFLLGTAFGALLMQRGILPIHGSAMVINGRCVIFTGVSGAGKSTLLAAFRKRGYSFLTDDVAAVTVDADGVAWVHSSYPQQKLWRDSAETMGVDTASLTPFYIGVNKDKFAVPVHKGFWQSPVPLVAVYELEAERCRDVTIRPLAGIDKLAVLMSHTYRPWLIDGLGLKAAHFKQCVAVARQVAVSRLTRPEGMFSVDEQVRLVQQDLARQSTDRAV